MFFSLIKFINFLNFKSIFFVYFFKKGALPAIDANAKLILENYKKVFMAPKGNSAVYESLVVHGCLKQM